MNYTTLNKIREFHPCEDGWQKLLGNLGKTKADDEPLSLLEILNSNGINDALWALRASDATDKDMRLYAVKRARRIQHLMTDPRSIEALDVAERFANGEATADELTEARIAAITAACAARATACAAYAAYAAADAAADAAAYATADAAAAAAACADACAAHAAARAAYTKERKWQQALFIEMFCGGV